MERSRRPQREPWSPPLRPVPAFRGPGRLFAAPFASAVVRERARRLVRVGTRSLGAFSEDDMATYAVALSYQVFFSLFPFVIFLVALLGSLRVPEFFDWLLGQTRAVLPGQAAGPWSRG